MKTKKASKAKPRKKPDIYDQAVRMLGKMSIRKVRKIWNVAFDTDRGHEEANLTAKQFFVARSLFLEASKERVFGRDRENAQCGCLTQVRGGTCEAQDIELTEMIQADDRLPMEGSKIKHQDLPVFAEWQRRIDKMLRRKPMTIAKFSPSLADRSNGEE